MIKLTKKYFSISKRGNFKEINNNDINYFQSIISPENTLQDDLDQYNKDWLKKYSGKSKLVLKPKSSIQISQILSYCNKNKIAVVPQSGNTGLVGGSVPLYDEVIISLKYLDKIISLDENNNTIHCQAGVILETLNEYLLKRNLCMPLDLASKGSCLVGGNLATNAGGINFIKYGSLRKNCLGLKVVLPDGEMLDLTSNNITNTNTKNITNTTNTINTNHINPFNPFCSELKQLFIGSEGSLGIITECIIKCYPYLDFKNLLLISVNKFEDIVSIYQQAIGFLGNNLSAIEFFDNEAFTLCKKQSNVSSPFNKEAKFYLLIESSSNKDENQNLLEQLYINISEKLKEDSIDDAVISSDMSQFKKLWEIRERISESSSKGGICFKYDISMKLQLMYDLVHIIRNKTKNLANTVGYGHIGDSNLHINVCYDKFDKDEGYYQIEKILEPFIFDYLKTINGSISAEHGVGVQKPQYLDRTQTKESIELMKQVKLTIDKNNIMNPYKIFNL